ncbi:MAG: glycyl radical protein [Emergencia timonensis]|uniref:glycyl radical protein n=2 Tax=Emergencia timonensis TaxID=1776384 RepID=UPI000834E1F7|nr:pyruvate formate lyase family protein [Emergencia timonensis]
MLSQRIEKLSKRVRDTQPTIDLDRARLITEFYAQPSMDNYILRRAKAFKHYLENMEIFIDDDEQLAGHQGSRVQSVILHPDTTKWLYDDFDTLDKRPSDNLAFRSEKDKEDLWEIVKKWRGNTFGDFASSLIDDDTKKMIEAGVLTHGISNQSTMNHSPDYDNFIKRGYRYYIDECREKLAAHKINDVYDMEQEIAWQSMIIVMESIINLAHRYADLAEQKAIECKDARRKEELLTMAENCRTVPENPPQTFLQATQLVWFHHLAITLEVSGGDHNLGRYDQYMLPFFEKEAAEGKTEEFFADIIHEFKLKIMEMWNIRCYAESVADPGCPLWMHIILGGVKENGKDACNELTRVFLRCLLDLQTDEPCISFRYHRNIDEETFRLAIKAARDTGGHPAFYNDDTAINYLLQLGFTLKEARNWGICGCIEPHVLGKSDFQSNPGYFNPIKIFDIMLHDGYDHVTDTLMGMKTGDPRNFKDIEDVKEAFKKQLQFFLSKFVDMYARTLAGHAYTLPTITGSTLAVGCMEKGKLLQQKGSDHHYTAIAITGMANVIDSLEAIDECVFKKKYISMDELIDMLDHNFEGHEEKRQMLLNKAPKFGNDIEEVDQYSYWLVDVLDTEAKKYRDAMGGVFTLVIATQAYNVELGKLIGATPDGRLAATPLADNASPMAGMDTNGPTAVVNSLACCDPLVPASGMLLNQRFDPTVCAGEKGLDIIETVFKAHFLKGGFHIQINVLDDKVLRAAQEEPDKYRNILVRVAGYSAYFVDLSEEIQNNIIDRTIQTGC